MQAGGVRAAHGGAALSAGQLQWGGHTCGALQQNCQPAAHRLMTSPLLPRSRTNSFPVCRAAAADDQELHGAGEWPGKPLGKAGACDGMACAAYSKVQRWKAGGAHLQPTVIFCSSQRHPHCAGGAPRGAGVRPPACHKLLSPNQARTRPYHLSFPQVERAVELGYDLRGVMYWTLVDNFEWGFGYSMRVRMRMWVQGGGCREEALRVMLWPGVACWGGAVAMSHREDKGPIDGGSRAANQYLIPSLRLLAAPNSPTPPTLPHTPIVRCVPMGERRQPEARGAQERRAAQELVRPRMKTGKDCDLCRTAPGCSSLGIASVALNCLPLEPYRVCFQSAPQVRQAAWLCGAAAGEAAAGRRCHGRRGGRGRRRAGAAAGGRLMPAAVNINASHSANQFCALQST